MSGGEKTLPKKTLPKEGVTSFYHTVSSVTFCWKHYTVLTHINHFALQENLSRSPLHCFYRMGAKNDWDFQVTIACNPLQENDTFLYNLENMLLYMREPVISQRQFKSVTHFRLSGGQKWLKISWDFPWGFRFIWNKIMTCILYCNRNKSNLDVPSNSMSMFSWTGGNLEVDIPLHFPCILQMECPDMNIYYIV